MTADLIELVQRLGSPRVLVIGDLMLDRYIWGDAARISQEAPVILMQADRREERLGGASSVATMLRALGARVALAGVVGTDFDGSRVRQLLTDLGIDHESVLCDAGRPTTVKERYIGRAQHRHPQQMIRVDYEDRSPISDELGRQLMHSVSQQIRKSDIVLISDYDKGVCTAAVLSATIQAAQALQLRTLADPIPGNDYRKYHGCSAITPNRLEAGLATGRVLRDRDEIFAAAQQLRDSLDLEAAIITLDKDGMALCHRDGRQQLFSTRPRQVYDITGAGDMVMSAMAMSLAAGADYDAAITLANVAGGLEVEKIGVATVTRDEIIRDLLNSGHHAINPLEKDGTHGNRSLFGNKLLAAHELKRELESRRAMGQRIAFTNGCFDVLHAGHVQYLEEARAQADLLVVGLNSDASVQLLKGPGRPLQPSHARARVLCGLQAVDYVCEFEEQTPLALIEEVRPDVLVKGSDYCREEVVGAEFVESCGGRVHLAAFRDGFSTTRLIERLKAA